MYRYFTHLLYKVCVIPGGRFWGRMAPASPNETGREWSASKFNPPCREERHPGKNVSPQAPCSAHFPLAVDLHG